MLHLGFRYGGNHLDETFHDEKKWLIPLRNGQETSVLDATKEVGHPDVVFAIFERAEGFAETEVTNDFGLRLCQLNFQRKTFRFSEIGVMKYFYRSDR